MQGQLAEYADAAAARRYARDIVALLAAGPRDDTGPPIVPTDVPSYWLPPAVRAVVARTSSDDAEADELVDVARGRDPERTDRFGFSPCWPVSCVVPTWANGLESQLSRTAKVTSIQRALWTAVAEGPLRGWGIRCLRAATAGGRRVDRRPGEEAVVARIDEARMAFGDLGLAGVAPMRKPDLPERDLVTLLAEDVTGKDDALRAIALDVVGRSVVVDVAGSLHPSRHPAAGGEGHGRPIRRRRRHVVGRRDTSWQAQVALRRHRARSRRGRVGGHRRHRRDGGTPRVRRAGACCRRSV